jgi:hypothetical protein
VGVETSQALALPLEFLGKKLTLEKGIFFKKFVFLILQGSQQNGVNVNL